MRLRCDLIARPGPPFVLPPMFPPLLALILAYPLLAHLAIWLHAPILQWAALTLLVATSMYDALRHGRVWAWIVLVVAGAALSQLVMLGGGIYAMYLPPVLLPLAMLALFANTLRKDSVPLVTRYAQAMRGPLPPELARYTGRVTMLWCVAFGVLCASGLGFALFASRDLWSFVTNIVHYVALGALFLVEYLYRRIRFRHLTHPGFVAYVRKLLSTPIKSV